MNMIRSAKNQIAELTAAAYRAAVQEGLLPEGVQTIPAVEIIPANFNSAKAMWKMIQRLEEVD